MLINNYISIYTVYIYEFMYIHVNLYMIIYINPKKDLHGYINIKNTIVT